MSTFRKTFLRNIFVSGGYNFISQLITFLSTIITSRLLFPENFGLVNLITVFSGFITIFSDSGVSYAIIRSSHRGTYHRGLYNLSLLIGAFLCVCMLILLYPISLFYNNPQIIGPGIAISFLFIVKSLAIVPCALLQKELQFNYLGRATLFSVVTGIAFTIILAALNFQHWAIILPQYAAALYLFIATNKRVQLQKRFSWRNVIASGRIAKKLIRSVIGFNLVNYWSRNTDNLLVGKFYGPTDLGIYNRAYQMLTFPLSFITGLFSSVLFPSLVLHKSNGGNVTEEYYFSLKLISVFNLPIAFILLVFPVSFVTILWGPHWSLVSDLLPYFGLLVLTQTLVSTIGSLLILESKEHQFMKGGWISALFIVTAISIGAFYSVRHIAAFYSLSYILFIIPVNIIYLYYRTLKQPLSLLLKFWLPKWVLSLTLWCSIWYSVPALTYTGLALWIFTIAIDTAPEIRKTYTFFSKRFVPSNS